ncbi:conjugal transfer protein TraF [Candidatus Tisiphia endosymbiont of Ceraclea dissimilis]|uniref:conjugal transfer protein TraF n=2 Tax=Candidatus Tisiphia endosymbiont of Ceraclea dissimilis TaxID=3077928 RepID=UPI003CCAC001
MASRNDIYAPQTSLRGDRRSTKQSKKVIRNGLLRRLTPSCTNVSLLWLNASRVSYAYILKILLICIVATNYCIPNYCYASNFFDQRYRGWIWFEEKEKAEKVANKQKELTLKEIQKQKYAKARQEVEQFSQELEELKFMMIRYPENIEHARRYKEKEAQMLEDSLKLAHTFRMVNFLYPEIINLIDNPINLYGRRIKEEINEQEITNKLKELSSKIELFVFFSSTCPYCTILEPVLNDFAKKYRFKVEAVSLDGSTSKIFKTHQNKGLADKLNLQRTPTIVVVTNDSKINFELIRGAASMSELEEAAIFAAEYLNKMEGTKRIAKEKTQVAENDN